MNKKILIAPSILSADFGKLNEEIREVEPYCDLIHLDVMDGLFVPSITFGQVVLKDLKSKKPFDVHLMISKPERYIVEFAKAGADIISFHLEATEKPKKTLSLIKKSGVKPALALKPATTLDSIEPFLNEVDFVLLMTVEPGFGGQEFLDSVLSKIKKLRELKPGIDIEVDGGINEKTAKLAVEAGANVLVAGSAVFGKKNREKAIDGLRKAALD